MSDNIVFYVVGTLRDANSCSGIPTRIFRPITLGIENTRELVGDRTKQSTAGQDHLASAVKRETVVGGIP